MQTDYLQISKTDILSKMSPYLDRGHFYIREDGKLYKKTSLSYGAPWIHTKQARNRNCNLYHIYHDVFHIVPATCQECWKVVVRPRTLNELHKLLVLQGMLDMPCKCGIEKRETVCGLYGGYFYNDSKEQGLDCYRIVRANVDKNLSPEVPVILKRGCTEFEIGGHGGPSDKWEVSQDQKDLEYILEDTIVQDVMKMPQPEHLKESVFRSWIHWAYANGDMTYKEFTKGEPLFPQYVTYHQEAENGGREEASQEHRSGSPERDSGRKRKHQKTAKKVG